MVATDAVPSSTLPAGSKDKDSGTTTPAAAGLTINSNISDKKNVRLDAKIEKIRNTFLPQMVYEAEARLKDHLDLMKFKMEKKIK